MQAQGSVRELPNLIQRTINQFLLINLQKSTSLFAQTTPEMPNKIFAPNAAQLTYSDVKYIV